MKRKHRDHTEDAFREKKARHLYEFKGQISRVLWPKQAIDQTTISGQRVSGGVILKHSSGKEQRWRVQLLSFDLDMFVHEVSGSEQDDGKGRFEPMTEADQIRTFSVPFSAGNSTLFAKKFLDSAFSKDADFDPTLLRQTQEAFEQLSTNPQQFENLENWLRNQQAAKWAQHMLRNQLVWTYIICKDGKLDRLLDLYPPSTFRDFGWTSSEMARLLHQIEEVDVYPFFFQNLIDNFKFPGPLPEIRLQRLSSSTVCKMGVQKLLDIWLYTSLVLNQEESKNTYVTIKPQNRRKFLQLASSHSGTIITHRQRYNEALQLAQFHLPVMERVQLPDSSHGDYTESIERLQKQQSILELSDGTVHVTKTWQQTLKIARLLRKFYADRSKTLREKKESSSSSSIDWKDRNALFEMMDVGSGGQRASAVPLCGEQLKALEMIEKCPVSILLGPGGSGKTEVISKLEGCGESIWTGGMEEVMKYPSEFYRPPVSRFRNKKRNNSKDEKQPELIVRKAQKLILTPTGIAARTAEQRGSLAVTLHHVLTCIQWGIAPERFDATIRLNLDEVGMVDEKHLCQVLEWAVKLPKLENIILSGDHRQLEPVEPGHVLRDLLKTWVPKIELTQNHRTDPSARQIASNAHAISEQRFDDVQFCECFKALKRGSKTLEGLYNTFKDIPEEFLLICYRTKCRDELNLNWMKFAGFIGDNDAQQIPNALFVGEKICFTDNIHDAARGVEVKNGQREIISRIIDCKATLIEFQMMNDESKNSLVFAERQSTLATLNDQLPHRLVICRSGMVFEATSAMIRSIRPGYATTLHSLQSGSVNHAILWDEANLMGRASFLWNQFIYTWVTRARKTAMFLTDSDPGIASPKERLRQCVKQFNKPRLTTLARHMGNDISKWPIWQSLCICCNQSFGHTFEFSDFPPNMCGSCEKLASFASNVASDISSNMDTGADLPVDASGLGSGGSAVALPPVALAPGAGAPVHTNGANAPSL